MEDNRRAQRRTLDRVCVSSRLEEQLWELAYKQLELVIRRAGQRPPVARERLSAVDQLSSAVAQEV
jgi:hypothetical protein